MMIELLGSFAWLIFVLFAVHGCPEDEQEKDILMVIAFLFFGVGGVLFYWSTR